MDIPSSLEEFFHASRSSAVAPEPSPALRRRFLSDRALFGKRKVLPPEGFLVKW